MILNGHVFILFDTALLLAIHNHAVNVHIEKGSRSPRSSLK